MLIALQLQCIIVRATDVHFYEAGDWYFCKTFTYLHIHKFIKSAPKVIKPAKMNSWAKQVSSLLILLVWVMFVCCKD